MDRSARGRLRFDGRDAGAFLQGLLTNDIASLGRGAGAYAAHLTPQGRLVADLRVYNRGDAFLADVAPGLAGELAARFDSMIFAEDVRVADISAATCVVTVVGATAADVIGSARGLDAASLATLRTLVPLAQRDAGEAVFVARADEADCPIFDVWAPEPRRAEVIAALSAAGGVEVSAGLLETLRIEAARPAFGVDMTTETIPLEAGLLERAISTTKGCYVGQEVIVRVLHRGGGRVARRLVQIAFDTENATRVTPGQAITAARFSPQEPPERPASTGHGVDRAGRITSVAFSPRLNRTIALGYVPRDVAETGLRVGVESAAGSVSGEILRLAG